jgi:hypothetical protein
MRRFPARFEGVSLSAFGEPSARITCDAKDIPLPGQAVLSRHDHLKDSLRKLIFPAGSSPDGFITDIAPDPRWNYGDLLDLLGPLGKGFTPPLATSKWLLVSFQQPPVKLLPLIDLGLERGVSITLFTNDAIPAVPPQVEVNPDLTDALRWADFFAIDLLLDDFSKLRSLLEINDLNNIPLDGQVLLTTPIPCGFGACGACSVKGQHSWKLACREGPVFDLSDLAW